MTKGYTKSPEGIEAYSKMEGEDPQGLKKYPSEFWDNVYDEFLRNSSVEGLPKGIKEKEYLSFYRIKPFAQKENEDPGEYLVYNFLHIRLTKQGNLKAWQVSRIGIYPIPHAVYKVKPDNYGNKKRVIKEIGKVTEGFVGTRKQKIGC
jgi:hypothetical protein